MKIKVCWIFLFFIFLISCQSEQKKQKKKTVSTKETSETVDKPTTIDTVLFSEVSSDIRLIYKKNKDETLWNDWKKRNQISEILSKASEYGLKKDDYHIPKLKKFISEEVPYQDLESHKIDLEITQKLALFLEHISDGKYANDTKNYEYYIKTTPTSASKWIVEMVSEKNIQKIIQKAEPSHPVYQSLKESLRILRNHPDETFEEIVFNTKIELNQTNPYVPTIKKILMFWGDLEKTTDSSKTYTPEMEIAIKKFQKRHGLLSDGVIGRGTIAHLNKSKKQREIQILNNLERWRWYPKNLGKHYLLVNIPDFQLFVLNNQDTVSKNKVIVGTKLRKTPLISSTLQSLVFNPTWTIPPTIKKEDVIPATKKNTQYLSQKKISVYNAKGELIEPNHWESSKALSYRYVQSPGTHNALGLVKFMFKNPFSVYLHDTNNRNMLAQHSRALSSGCVRVENPIELAQYILSLQKEISLGELNETLSSGKTFQEKITTDIQVHLWYWTAWSEHGQLNFREDIYGLDHVIQ